MAGGVLACHVVAGWIAERPPPWPVVCVQMLESQEGREGEAKEEDDDQHSCQERQGKANA